MPRFVCLLAVAAILAFTSPSHAQEVSDPKSAPSGTYQIDPDHTNVIFKVSHLGFSFYVGRFDKIEGKLNYNNTSPEQSTLEVTIAITSIDTNNDKLQGDLLGQNWFNTAKFPRAIFHATKIERTGPLTGKITGDFTMKGQTHTVVLDTHFVGAGVNPLTSKYSIGFSATGMLHRSDYDMSNLLPMVGNDVTFEIEAEMDSAE